MFIGRTDFKAETQYFGHLMQRADSLEKTLMLGKIESRRRRGQQRMRWLDGIINYSHHDPWAGRSPEEVNGNPLQCSCLENPMDRGTWWATVHGVAKNQTLLSN